MEMTLHLPIKDNSFSHSRASNCLFGINAPFFKASSNFPPGVGFSRWGVEVLWVTAEAALQCLCSASGQAYAGDPSCCREGSVAIALTDSAGACE